MTSNPNIETVHHPLRMRMLTVRSTTRPTPRLVRVRLGGDDLDGFVSLGPADHVKVFFPEDGEAVPEVPELGPNGIVRDPARTRPYRSRDYTPRHGALLTDGVLEIDVVLHDHGVAADWARRAEVGDTLGVAGPRGSHLLTTAVDAFVLCGDETALPAIQNWLLAAPPDSTALAIVEVDDEHDIQELSGPPGVDVVWALRRGVAPGQGSILIDAVRSADLPPVATTFFWAAGEAGIIRQIRRHLIDERGIAPDFVETRGYWRLDTEDHQEPHDD